MLQFVVDDVVLAVPEPRGYPVIFSAVELSGHLTEVKYSAFKKYTQESFRSLSFLLPMNFY